MNGDKILVINGSYRDDGITDQAVAVALEVLQSAGADTELIELRDFPIEYCLNCRACTQQPGREPGACVLNDAMPELIDKIENAQAYIFAAPTNFGSVTAIFKRFIERLIVYAYWPWQAAYPRLRKTGAKRKKAMLISSSAAPSLLARWLFGSVRQLKMTAQIVGAESVGCLFTGGVGKDSQQVLTSATADKTRRLARQLLSAAQV